MLQCIADPVFAFPTLGKLEHFRFYSVMSNWVERKIALENYSPSDDKLFVMSDDDEVMMMK